LPHRHFVYSRRPGCGENYQSVKKAAKATGNKTAELASKGKSKVTDQVYKNKVGPNGQTIYIDDHSRYYWVDKKGHRDCVAEVELKDKAK